MSAPYAAAGDVTRTLGTIGDRLPAWVDVEEFLAIGHAITVDELALVYPGENLPEFDGDGLAIVKLAEAKYAAAEILDAIAVMLSPADRESAAALRASADASLGNGVLGYPAGSVGVDSDGDPDTPPVQVQAAPRVSSYTPMSAFPDPYEAARSLPFGESSRY